MRTLRPRVERGMTSSIEHLVLSDVGHISLVCKQMHGKASKQVREID